ncbi:MAG: methyltransferase domain-containing protein [Planctomycetes bacterium]|nr:methyltransferase domain-containing protein [Planctomycetota bacterium]
MKTPFTDHYDKQYLLETMMGPNAMRIAEEMTASLSLPPNLRILDLGCGMGITSILLAEKYDATVFAADLWISPSDNAERFSRLGLDAKIFPFLVDATKEIPFAHDYFDMILSVDAYQYFGTNEEMLPKLLPFLKKGGLMAVAVPGFNQDFPDGELPDEVRPFWTPEWYFYSCRWWRDLWLKEPGMELIESREMDCCRQAWDEWLESPSQHADGDIPMMEAGTGKYFSIIQLIGRKV